MIDLSWQIREEYLGNSISQSCILLGTLLLCIFPLGSSSGGTYGALCQPVFPEWHALSFKGLLTCSKTAPRRTQLSHLNKQMIAHTTLPLGISKQLPHLPLFGAVLHPCTNLSAHKFIQKQSRGATELKATMLPRAQGEQTPTYCSSCLVTHSLTHPSLGNTAEREMQKMERTVNVLW